MLCLVATTARSANLTAEQMRGNPAAGIVFIADRAAFWVGYRMYPLYRAFGMAATAYLNLAEWPLATGDDFSPRYLMNEMLTRPARAIPEQHLGWCE
jgi:hypothetical protein